MRKAMILVGLLALLISALVAPARAQSSITTSVVLFVDSKFYAGLATEIQRLAADVESDLSTTAILQVIDVGLTSPEDLRAAIRDLYANQGLLGAVLIGDIPAALLGDFPSAPTAATDAFYEDLDDWCWTDPDGNGIYNSVVDEDGDGEYDWFHKTWIGEHNREIWTGRLQPPASVDLASRTELLRAYLDRNHEYRVGERSYQRGMVYAESVAHNGEPGDFEDDYDTIYGRAVAVMDGSWLFDRQAGDVLDFVWSDDLTEHMNLWLAGVNTPYEYGLVNVHGAATAQWFGASNWLFSGDYQSTPANTLLVDFASCSNGDFTHANYLAGWALFGGDSLAVIANTTVTFYVGSPKPDPRHRLLSLGLTLGETRLAEVLSNDSSALLGDPTLRLREPAAGSPVTVDVNPLVLPPSVVPGLPAGYTGADSVTLTNDGDEPVEVHYRIRSLASIDGRRPWGNEFQSSFYVEDNWQDFPFTLSPGESRSVSVDFYYDGQSGAGTYRARFLLYTDSPATPFFWVLVEKRLYDRSQFTEIVHLPLVVR